MRTLLDQADAFVIVDVLSFTTSVDVACANGAHVFPFPTSDRAAAEREAVSRGAILAGSRSDADAPYSLSSSSLRGLPAGATLVLPSPNGSRLAYAARDKPVLAGCLRNASAVARAVSRIARSGTVAVVPAGERWPDGSLRPAIEDWLGAGAIIANLDGDFSAEATVARDTFTSARSHLADRLMEAVSGVELVQRGFARDVGIAAEMDVSSCAPLLLDTGFVAAK
ncbi:2-phosphosulfolactate phosphatase [Bauldia sp.]|uniref:2-phosphosulfolactate phosphatase n=1 Tax=Bauldia sp. TaxID=2575872 RepID=UPI003BAD4528